LPKIKTIALYIEIIPCRQFEIPLQVIINGKIISGENIKSLYKKILWSNVMVMMFHGRKYYFNNKKKERKK